MPLPAWVAPTITAGGTIASAFLGSRSSESGIEATNAANAQIARENREWQERMDNTKYQRGVADARAAGFNPLVAFPGGAGTPIPSTPTMMNPKVNRGELFLATAKALADIKLTNKMAETEETKQELNRAETRSKGGVISVPGFGWIPIDRALDALSGGARKVAPPVSTASQGADFAHGKINRAGQRTGR